MPKPINKRVDILYDTFLTKPSTVEGKKLFGLVLLDDGILSFIDVDGYAIARMRVRNVDPPVLRTLLKLSGDACQIEFEPRKGWFKYGGSPYMRLHINAFGPAQGMQAVVSKTTSATQEDSFRRGQSSIETHPKIPDKAGHQEQVQDKKGALTLESFVSLETHEEKLIHEPEKTEYETSSEVKESQYETTSSHDEAPQQIPSMCTSELAKVEGNTQHLRGKLNKTDAGTSNPMLGSERTKEADSDRHMFSFPAILSEGYKRGPADYYQEHYQRCRSLAFTLETLSSESEAENVYSKLDASTMHLNAVRSSKPHYTWSIDGINPRSYNKTVGEALAELLHLGYTAFFDLELKANELERYSSRKTYSIIAVPTLRRPNKLGGTEFVPAKLFPKKKADEIHNKIINLCKEGVLFPYEALAAECVALGATRAEIAAGTGWDESETEARIRLAYSKLGVSSKLALEKKLGITVSRIAKQMRSGASPRVAIASATQTKIEEKSSMRENDNIEFTFELAGTSHHMRGANQLEDGDTSILSARREPNNEYDDNAIAIRANGYKAGYVPADDAEDLAELMDNGYSIEFTSVLTSHYYKRKKRKVNLGYGEYYYEYEEDYDHPVPTAIISLICKKPVSSTTKAMRKTEGAESPSKQRGSASIGPDGIHYVTIGDFIVRSHGYSCRHKGHEMTPVEAYVTVLVANSLLMEQKFRAFYCEQCGMYFVTDTAFERLSRSGRLCCRIIAMEEVLNPKRGDGRFSDYATESLIHQYGYNVNKSNGLTSASRQAILAFIIENNIMGLYEIISFLEGLIRTRSGMRNMDEAIAKWKEDVIFLEHYRPPKRSLKVGTLYAKRSMLR